MENYIVINGKKAELTKEQMKQLGLIKNSPFDRVEKNEKYYSIDPALGIISGTNFNISIDKANYETANYCTDKDILQQRAWHEILERLLWRFSCENGGLDIDWNNLEQSKYQIIYKADRNDFSVIEFRYNNSMGVYFISEKIAERAIVEIIYPFLAKYPNFKW